MAEENLTPEQEAEANLEQEGQETVSVEDFKNMQKGIEKMAETINSLKPSGGKEAEITPVVEEANPKMSNVVKNLYLERNPEFSEVEDEVNEEARSLGVDPIDYYESKMGWKLEAKARANANEEKEKAKNAIESPSGNVSGNEVVDFSKIKPEEIKGLSKEQMTKYREHLKRGSEMPIKRHV